ncbi:MAG TPA: DUF167 domain-containing protein [Fimbriimonadales bacterium]|nr:DUF167 domain-containing protein [Fimbriimonadales bacterium]
MSGSKSTTRIEVKVTPRAKSNRWEWRENRLHLYVTSPPVEGKANEECIRLLSEALGIPRRTIHIARGAKSREKVFTIEGLTFEDIKERLDLS